MCFNVSILDDEIEESEEYFLVMITSGDPQVKLSPSTTALTIVDNDCPVGMVFNECGSACPPSCDDQSPICIKQCVRGKFNTVDEQKNLIIKQHLESKPFCLHNSAIPTEFSEVLAMIALKKYTSYVIMIIIIVHYYNN